MSEEVMPVIVAVSFVALSSINIAALAWRRLSSLKSSRTRVIVLAIVYAASLASLIWTLHDAELGRLIDDITGLNGWSVSLGVASILAAYFVQGFRWKLLLTPVGSVSVFQASRAIFVGLFASEVFPIRAGEIIRCYLVRNWTGILFSVSLASVLIERMFDGLVMWLCLRFALRAVKVPISQQLAVDSLGVLVMLGLIVVGIALFRPKLKHSRMPESGWRKRWFVLQEDLALIGHSGYLWAALAATVPYLLLQVVPIYLLFREYNFNLSLGPAVALTMLIRLAAALPQAPATLGLFQVLTREFLVLGFGVMPDEASRFSLVLWGIVKLPILVSGAIAVAITGTKIGELTRAAQEAQRSSS